MKNMTDMEYIKRDIYLQKLIDSRLNGDVKVVTGPRRCGKSWLLTRLYWKNRARETLDSGCLLTLLVTKKRSTKVAIKLTPARVILTGDFFRSFGFRPGRRGN